MIRKFRSLAGLNFLIGVRWLRRGVRVLARLLVGRRVRVGLCRGRAPFVRAMGVVAMAVVPVVGLARWVG